MNRALLLGSCTPARAGAHEVRIETSVHGEDGGRAYKLNANGFAPDCDPTRKTSFNIKRPRNPRPVISSES